jgi:hypothetical protein
LLKEKCPWHLDDNHTIEQCYQLRRALKDTPDPRHPHDKKGKKKNDEGNCNYQEPDKTVNVLFGGLPSRRVQKATRREVMSIEPAVPTPLRWSEVPITFSCADQWTSFSESGRFPLVLKPVVAGSKLNKVLIDGGSGLNVLFTKTLKKMKLDITHMLTKRTSPFYGIVPGNADFVVHRRASRPLANSISTGANELIPDHSGFRRRMDGHAVTAAANPG